MSRRRRLPQILSQTESDALAQTARAEMEAARTPKKKFAAHRDLVMIATGSMIGLRNFELCKLEVPHLDLAGRQMAVRGGKGDKDAYLPISRKLAEILAAWIGDRKTGPAFPGPGGRRLSLRTFELRLAALARRAGIIKRVYPHMLRHTFATSLLRKGSDIVRVSRLMRHSDVRTTLIYLHVDTTPFQEDVDRL